jgi:hypothetical protein
VLVAYVRAQLFNAPLQEQHILFIFSQNLITFYIHKYFGFVLGGLLLEMPFFLALNAVGLKIFYMQVHLGCGSLLQNKFIPITL